MGVARSLVNIALTLSWIVRDRKGLTGSEIVGVVGQDIGLFRVVNAFTR